MTETHTPYLTGNEPDEKPSALRDLKLALQQYEEAGGNVMLTSVTLINEVIISLQDVKISEWRRI